MAESLEKIRRMAIAISPSILIFALTLVIFHAAAYNRLFLSRSIGSIPLRFIVITFILILPILVLPKLLIIISGIMRDGLFSFQLVRSSIGADRNLSGFVAWFLRPLQGISLALILAERFLNIFESSISPLPGTYTKLLVSYSFFLLLTSIFLSVVWSFDDLGIMIFNSETTEVRMAGSSIGTILPLITGAIGVSALYHSNLSPIGAFIYLLEIVMVLYPPYVILVVLQNEFIKMRCSDILSKLNLSRVETQCLKIT